MEDLIESEAALADGDSYELSLHIETSEVLYQDTGRNNLVHVIANDG